MDQAVCKLRSGLSETQLAGEDSLREVGEGYTFFWKGLPEQSDRIHGVGFAIKTELLRHHPESPIGISERIMTFRNPLAPKVSLLILLWCRCWSSCGVVAGPPVLLLLVLLWCRCWSSFGVDARPLVVSLLFPFVVSKLVLL